MAATMPPVAGAVRPAVVRWVLGLFLLVAAVLWPATAWARSESWPKEVETARGGAVKILYDADFTRVPNRGYAVVKFTISNGTDAECTWRASLAQDRFPPYGPYYRGSGGREGSRGFIYRTDGPPMTVPARATREFVVSLGLIYPGSGNLEVDGPHLNERRLAFQSHGTSLLADGLLPASFFAAWEERADAKTGKSGYRGGADILSRTDFPEDWRYYSAFRLVVLRTATWAELGTAQRGALRGYVAAGGTLAFVGPDDQPFAAPAEFGIATPLGAKLPGVTYGLGSVDAVASAPAECAEGVHKLAQRSAEPDRATWLDPLPGWLAANLPRAALILVLLAAAFLAGPGALFWLAKRQQRHRLFIVLPAVATGTSLILIAVILLNDGTGGDGRRAVLATLIDGRPEMIVYQQQAARCGFLLRTDFTVPEEAQAELRVPRSMAGEFVVNRRGALCTGDWFRNRSATVQTLVHTVPTRAALALQAAPEGGVPTVVSTFPAPLRNLAVFSGGKSWRAALVPPGVPTPLEPDEGDEERERMHFRFRLAEPFPFALEHAFEGNVLSDCFLAETDRLEGAPIPTLESIRWTDTIFVSGRVTKGGRP